jgi:cobaltochelatase CobN
MLRLKQSVSRKAELAGFDMHLLLAQKGAIADNDEAIDLGQSTGDILFLSSADTEISSLANAQNKHVENEGGKNKAVPSLRLANLMTLSHPMSIDVYAEKMIASSKLIVLRVLGGKPYWSYGIEKFFSIARAHNVPIAILPGDDKPDASLAPYNSVGEADQLALWHYLIEGGEQNMLRFLACAKAIIEDAERPESATPLLKAGLYWPKEAAPDIKILKESWIEGAPVVAISFYRALLQSGTLEPIDALIAAMQTRGINPLPVFLSSLKDPISVETLSLLFDEIKPNVVVNLTGFAVSNPNEAHKGTVLEQNGAVVLQAILAGGSHEQWLSSDQGLSARDLAMNVALPEVDGRILSRAIAFKDASQFDEQVEANVVKHSPDENRVAYVAELAANWAKLQRTKAKDRNIALIMANYPNRDGRLGNGVGLDTPQSMINMFKAMNDAGYDIKAFPENSDELMCLIQEGPTNSGNDGRLIREVISLNDYNDFFENLPEELQKELIERWGDPKDDPYFIEEQSGFALPLMRFGKVMVGIQPARGYNIDPKETYHSPDLVPPHGYLAFYAYLRNNFNAHAIAHMGKHGNLEWLPGKALALSKKCYPEVIQGALPHIYPFIVNDPGEGTQAKRRTSAVIIDHLTPPLTRAESYGPLKDLEALVDEYYLAVGTDPRRTEYLKREIMNLVRDIGLDEDAGIKSEDDEEDAFEKLDAYLCDLKEMQIRDGLHCFGAAPEGELARDLLVALVRVPRGMGEAGNASLHRALANDMGLDFDPLNCEMAKPWQGAQPELLSQQDDSPWRTHGDTVERIEILAQALVMGEVHLPIEFEQSHKVMQHIKDNLEPKLNSCGDQETQGFLTALEGKHVMPGASGAPTRGREDVLPTGRNFYSVDSRAVPTPAAWNLGQKSAELLIKRYRQDNGEWPSSFGLSAWGTSNMRTGGDDIAQAFALIGAKPTWDHASRRVTGYEIIPLAKLSRPRVDVTLRISGFFRDAFPAQIALFDQAIRAVGALDEVQFDNPIAHRMNDEKKDLIASGHDNSEAELRSGFRIFGSKPGAYGAGLQALMDEDGWRDRTDLAESYLTWGAYAYGAKAEGQQERKGFETRLKSVEAVVHNQDNREHDLLDSDDYYQFEGGMTVAVETLKGERPRVYHNDHSRPENPKIRSLEEEIARVVRGRVINPKWIKGVMRHGYKGAFEMAATTDYLVAFGATTGAVKDHHYDALYQAYLVDEEVLGFLQDKNPESLKEMAQKLLQAIERGLWTARSNSAKFELERIIRGATDG